jgi:hypothetical protein
MSRLTASPFHKPSPFSMVRPAPFPLSPPDTDREFMHPHSNSRTTLGRDPALHNTQEYDFPDLETRSNRKGSSLSYNTSGLRESRQRTVQRGLKSFVIVIPPASFLAGHGQLGTTLSSGPLHRLSQGILMPLFPTMYAQLAAIAKEFNFPSTTGLCLYLHYTESGTTLSPRISDDSWSFLWSHAFEPRPAQPSLPISGRIEFDIDLQQARWYTSWLSSSTREYPEIQRINSPSLVMHRGSQFLHTREESRTTFGNGSIAEETNERDYALLQPQSRKHIPRKLSLVDRYDSLSVRSGSGTVFPGPAAASPPEAEPRIAALSPIVQEDEPQTARQNLQDRVNNWRASATLQPTPLAAVGQISLEPANLPNNMDLDDEQLNLEDFTWSISSLGPGDSPLESIASWDRVQSVHLDSRLRGSVCMTPSTHTSFGPADYDVDSDYYANDVTYLLSPDIAHRQFSDCPLTPSTVTSWGAPLSYPSTPDSLSATSSVDIAHRGRFSRPVTPLTVTSWGPSSWPGSPVEQYVYQRAPSVHLGDRGAFSRPVTPSTATSWGAPSPPPFSPITWDHIRTPSAWERSFDIESAEPERGWRMGWPHYDVISIKPWPLVWPSYNVERDVPWKQAWPYNTQGDGSRNDQDRFMSVGRQPGYPDFTIYTPVYPWNLDNIYPIATTSPKIVDSSSSVLLTERLAYPRNLDFIYPSEENAPLQQATGLGYPHNLEAIYSVVETTAQHIPANPVAPASSGYPHNLENIYPTLRSRASVSSAHRDEDPTPTVAFQSASLSRSLIHHRTVGYPSNLTNLYPLVEDLHGSLPSGNVARLDHPYDLLASYPTDAQGYRTKVPAATATLAYPWNLNAIYPYVTVHSRSLCSSVNRGLIHFSIQSRSPAPANSSRSSHYPFNLSAIYPHVDESVMIQDTLDYPHNLDHIYPTSPNQNRTKTRLGYPLNLRNIYSPRHPSSIIAQVDDRVRPWNSTLATPPLAGLLASGAATSHAYPWNLYCIYLPSEKPNSAQHTLDYPHNPSNIYPPWLLSISMSITAVAPRSGLGYPLNLQHIYPAAKNRAPTANDRKEDAYPWNLLCIYSARESVATPISRTSDPSLPRVASEYPWHLYTIYPPLDDYLSTRLPHVDLQSAASMQNPTSSLRKNATRELGQPQFYIGYPRNLDHIYPSVRSISEQETYTLGYPWNLYSIYSPSLLITSDASLTPANNVEPCESSSPTVSIFLKPSYPNLTIYPSVYPYNLVDIYPAIAFHSHMPKIGPDMLPHLNAELSELLCHLSRQGAPTASIPVMGHGMQEERTKRYVCFLPEPLTEPSLSEEELPLVCDRLRRRTHEELHHLIFPTGNVETPSGTTLSNLIAVATPVISPRSSRQLNRMSLPPPSPSPRSKLPPIPTGEELRRSPRTSPNSSSPPVPLPRPRLRPIVPRPSTLYSDRSEGFAVENSEPPMNHRRVGYKPPTRSVSMALPSSPAVHLTRSSSSSKVNHARRDSIVLQRIRALNTSSAPVNEITEEVLAQFPLPPRPPLPRTGKLDRTKYPFA